MFLRLVADSFGRRPRHKLLTGAALALGMGVATAALSVALDVGDRLAKEFRSLGANLVVTPKADSLPLEIGGVDYRPVNAGAYLPEADLPKLKTIFWHNNIMAFSPVLEARAEVSRFSADRHFSSAFQASLIGVWVSHKLSLADGTQFVTGVEKANPWWRIEGTWFRDGKRGCVVGRNLARTLHLQTGDIFFVHADSGQNHGALSELYKGKTVLPVVGILDAGGPEDDAVVLPLETVQAIAAKPGQYRNLYVSALTKPDDCFTKEDRK